MVNSRIVPLLLFLRERWLAPSLLREARLFSTVHVSGDEVIEIDFSVANDSTDFYAWEKISGVAFPHSKGLFSNPEIGSSLSAREQFGVACADSIKSVFL